MHVDLSQARQQPDDDDAMAAAAAAAADAKAALMEQGGGDALDLDPPEGVEYDDDHLARRAEAIAAIMDEGSADEGSEESAPGVVAGAPGGDVQTPPAPPATPTLEEQRLALERERLEWDRARHQEALAAQRAAQQQQQPAYDHEAFVMEQVKANNLEPTAQNILMVDAQIRAQIAEERNNALEARLARFEQSIASASAESVARNVVSAALGHLPPETQTFFAGQVAQYTAAGYTQEQALEAVMAPFPSLRAPAAPAQAAPPQPPTPSRQPLDADRRRALETVAPRGRGGGRSPAGKRPLTHDQIRRLGHPR